MEAVSAGAVRPDAVGRGVRAGRRPLRIGPLLLALPALAFLAALLFGPALRLFALGFQDSTTGEPSLAHYARAFGVGVYPRVLGDTFAIAAEVTLASLLLGFPLAVWLSGLPPARRRLTAFLVLLPFWTSALVKNFAWLVLLGRNGPVAAALNAVGLPSELLFGRGAVLFAMTHTMLPLGVVTMLPVLNRIDRRLPLAAGTLGASPAQAFWRVFVPMSVPGVAAAGLLVFIGSLGFFITPALLGGRGDTMLGQVVILQVTQLQNWNFAAALATMLVGAALVTCLVYDRVFGLSAVAGEGGAGGRHHGRLARRLGRGLAALAGEVADRLSALGRRIAGPALGRALLPAYSVLLIALLVLPILCVIPLSLTSSTFLSFPPPGLSARWFVEYFDSPVWRAATGRSFAVGAAVAGVTLLLGLPAAYGLARTRSRWGGAVFLLLFAPTMVPSIVVALALFYLFASLRLVATDLGLILGHTVTSLPIALVVLLASFRSHDWGLDRAAATLGAGPVAVFRRVTLPLVGGAVAVAAIFAFLHSFEELTIAIFVGAGLTTTLPKQMWDTATLSVTPTLAAASVVVLGVVFGLFAATELLGHARRRRTGRTATR